MAEPLIRATPSYFTGERLRRLVREAPRRELAVLVAVIAVSLLLRLVTWNELADGLRDRYVKTTIFGAASAAAVWGLMRLQTGAGSWVPILAAAAVLGAGDAVHYVRLANPIVHGGPVLAFNASFADESAARRQWDIETTGGGAVRFDRGAMVLESPAGGTAYVTARLDSTPDARVMWWLPVGLGEREQAERLSWRASVERTGDFYVVTEIRQLLIQVVSYGLHLTYPDERGTARGHEINHPLGGDGQMHEWVLLRNARQISLSIDGKQVWAAPQRQLWNQVKLGETKADAQHGGRMRVEAVSYTSTLERE